MGLQLLVKRSCKKSLLLIRNDHVEAACGSFVLISSKQFDLLNHQSLNFHNPLCISTVCLPTV